MGGCQGAGDRLHLSHNRPGSREAERVPIGVGADPLNLIRVMPAQGDSRLFRASPPYEKEDA